MPRYVWLIRHAKSAWPTSVDDLSRPLAERGISDGQVMAKIVAEGLHVPQLWISSDALRTQQTVKLLNREVNAPIELDHRLYMAKAADVLKVLHAVDSQHTCVALTTHMPTIQSCSRFLANEQSFPQLPSKYSTLCMICFEVTCTWAAIEGGSAQLVESLLPKDYRHDNL